MTQRQHRKKLISGALLMLMAAPLWAQTGGSAPFTDYPSYVAWMHAHHKAPFNASGAVMPQGGAKALQAAVGKAQGN